MTASIDPALLAAALERAPVGIILLGTDGRPLGLNAEGRRLLGLGAELAIEALAGEEALGAFAPRSLDGTALTRRTMPAGRLLAGEPAPPVRLRVQSASGAELVLHVEASELRDGEGRLLGALELFRDVTEEVERERLRELRGALAALFDEGLEAAALLPRLGRLCAGPLAPLCLLARLRPDGAPTALLVHLADPAASASSDVLHACTLPQEVAGQGLWQVARSGEARSLEGSPAELARFAALDEPGERLFATLGARTLRAEPLRARGRLLGALAFAGAGPSRLSPTLAGSLAAEVAQRLALALDAADGVAQTRAALVARDEFLQVASHDLRNPLGVVALNAELLEQLGPLGERPARLVGGIRRAAAQMTRLVSDLLDVAALDAGQLRLVLAELDVGALVNEVVEQQRERAAHAGISLVARLEPTPRLVADRGRLLQVLGNLVENALRVSPAGSEVELAARPVGARVELTLGDRGPGRGEGDEGELFRRFRRGANGGRAGLGLTIARGLVEAHGGTLAWEPRVGGGSIFRLRLGG